MVPGAGNGTPASAASTAAMMAAISSQAGRIVVDEAFGQPDRPERQADVERDLAAGGDHDLRRAAADVDHRERPRQRDGKRLRHRLKRERCLARAVDHFDRSPENLGGWLEERRRVWGAPQRLGSDGCDLRLVPARDRRELPQGGQRSGDPLVSQRATRADAAAETGDLRPLLHQLECATRRQPRHQEQGGVGPDVDRRQVHARRACATHGRR